MLFFQDESQQLNVIKIVKNFLFKYFEDHFDMKHVIVKCLVTFISNLTFYQR